MGLAWLRFSLLHVLIIKYFSLVDASIDESTPHEWGLSRHL